MTEFLQQMVNGLAWGSIYALIALGYKPQDASRMVVAVNDEGIQSSEDLIRRALKSMVKG